MDRLTRGRRASSEGGGIAREGRWRGGAGVGPGVAVNYIEMSRVGRWTTRCCRRVKWFPTPDVKSGRETRGEVCMREVWTWGRFWDLPFVRGIDLTGNDYSFSGLFWCIVKVRVFYFCGGVACRGGKGEIWGFRSRGDVLAPVPLDEGAGSQGLHVYFRNVAAVIRSLMRLRQMICGVILNDRQ